MHPSPSSTSFRRLRGALAAAVVWVAAQGCAHPQDDGLYTLTAELPPIRDDCGLLEAPALGSGSLVVQGEVVRLTLWVEDLELRSVGAYLAGAERFAVDGSTANVTTRATGGECFLDFAQVHVDARTQAKDRFDGTLRLSLQSETREDCACELWTAFTAVRG